MKKGHYLLLGIILCLMFCIGYYVLKIEPMLLQRQAHIQDQDRQISSLQGELTGHYTTLAIQNGAKTYVRKKYIDVRGKGKDAKAIH